MKILHISDTHSAHEQLIIGVDVDMIIHSGDESNYRSVLQNEYEFRNFINWFSSLNVKHKLMIPGNHSTFIYHNTNIAKQIAKQNGIILLINESIVIEGLKIYGTPITETFFNWAYNVDKGKIAKYWENIPDDIDILISHGPVYGILDIARGLYSDKLVNTGCKSLKKRIEELKKLKAFLFGHIHDNEKLKIKNRKVITKNSIIYSNASCVTDGVFLENKKGYVLTSHGNIINL